MEKQHKNWKKVEELHYSIAADLFQTSLLTQEQYDFLAELSDGIILTPLKEIIFGELFSINEGDIKLTPFDLTVESYSFCIEKCMLIVEILQASDLSHLVSSESSQDVGMSTNLAVKLSLKNISLFNFAVYYLSGFQKKDINRVSGGSTCPNFSSLRDVFKHIGKLYHFCCILCKNYTSQYEKLFLQTIDTISTHAEMGFCQKFDNIINKTILFLHQVVHENTIIMLPRTIAAYKKQINTADFHNLRNHQESEKRLNKVVEMCDAKLNRSSSEDQLSLERSMENGLNKGIEINVKDYDSNTQCLKESHLQNVGCFKITVKNNKTHTEDVIKFGMYERNRSYYLQNADDWAEKIIKNWSLSEGQIRSYLTNAGAPTPESEELYQNIIKDLNDLLASYAPVIKSTEFYNKILEICNILPVKIDALRIFLIHQFKSESEESWRLISQKDIQTSEKDLIDCLFRPFSAKSLKDEYDYLILKIRDYNKYTIEDPTFMSRHLEDETKRKEFINRCFFSNIEKLIGKLEDISPEKRKLFYLLIMKILPKMSEKQQKNLNKILNNKKVKTSGSKITEIPEGLHNFLKKQIKLLKEKEFERLKDKYEQLNQVIQEFESQSVEEMPFSEAKQIDPPKMSNERVKEFCTTIDEVISIVKSNQKYCVELGGSLQAWVFSEHKWVSLLLSLPKIPKLPKANQEQIKRSFRHLKELFGCNNSTNQYQRLMEQMRLFIESWGLTKNTEWTKLID
ncbi:unnamed protein product [Moneuplotes crassus]|uniref:Uncharacterized protein n=2 Tax=Euplotes crassus TaxID=5936 RepID=A0AAD1Y7V9_EUPCR|nr:unnamed protein product [Moneuplotes crassus]